MSIYNIEGLRWEKRWRANNGKDSWVVPFPTTKPANVVYHGTNHFDYGQYGIHIGQEDRLTFLGKNSQIIKASFIDCRENSKTFSARLNLEFQPSSEQTLCIPPGIAHTFIGLENIFTINEYEIYLPEPDRLYQNIHNWNLTGDILNIPIDINDNDLPKISENTMGSSAYFYEILRQKQLMNTRKIEHSHPVSYQFQDNEGILKQITIKEKIKNPSHIPNTWTSIEGIFGLGWMSHYNVMTSKDAGIIALLEQSPFYFVDHGENYYSHDSYGIHLGQEDRLTFLGNPNQTVELTLVDCRYGSSTLHNKRVIQFNPSPLQYLIIPPGVAHAFKNLENVFTINRPRILIDSKNEYCPRNDVIDWPLNNERYPIFKPNKLVVDSEYYNMLAVEQKKFILDNTDYYETPKSHLMTDPLTGNKYRITLRKKLSN